MSGLLKTHIQLGDSATATQNFTLTSQAADGTMKLARGNFGATTQDVITVDANGRVTWTQGINATVSASVSNTVTNKVAMVINGTTYYLLASISGT